MTDQSHTYYKDNLEAILADFKRYSVAMQQEAQRLIADKRLPEDGEITARLEKVWDCFAAWVPDLPYIGGKENSNTSNLLFGAWLVCLNKQLAAHGYTHEQVGLLLYETMQAVLPPAPGGPPSAEKVAEIIARRQAVAQASMLHKYPYDWQTTYIEGDSATFDWGVDYHTCGIHRLFAEHGILDFLPYACILDLPSYRSLGIGVVRTKTLSRGDDRCNFRFNLRDEYSFEAYPDYVPEELRGTSDGHTETDAQL